VTNICKIWIKSVKKWHDYSIKLFSWGCVASGAQIIHIWPCLKPYYCKTTLVNNPNISGMLTTMSNIGKVTLSILWLSKVKGHGSPKLTVSSSCYRFLKIFKPHALLFLNSFRSYLDELLLIKLSLTLENFIAKYQKVCESKRFTHDWVTKATKVPHFSSFFISCQVWPKVSHKPFNLLKAVVTRLYPKSDYIH